MKHENIIELYDYFESDKNFVMLMEYANDAKYFEHKIENVSLLYVSVVWPFYLETNGDQKWRKTKVLLHGHADRTGLYPQVKYYTRWYEVA